MNPGCRYRQQMWKLELPRRFCLSDFRHIDELSELPFHSDHRDPFDRMMIAQALAEDLPMVSNDTRFEEYKRQRVIWK